MKRPLLVVAVAAFGIGAPATARACLCEVTVTAPGTVPDAKPWMRRAVVFVGTVLGVDPSGMGVVPERSRWVVEASWRGELPDTVTLHATGTGCPGVFFAGSRYLVFADRINSELHAGQCSVAWSLMAPVVASVFADLGPPSWVPPEFPNRQMDAGVVRIGDAPPGTGPPVRVGVGFADPALVRLVRIADQTWIRNPARPASFNLAAGVYRMRVILLTGDSTDSYIEVRCDQRLDRDTCFAHRFLAGQRVSVPGTSRD